MKIKNERGLTLVELLAVVVISAILIILVTRIYVSALNNYEDIKAETELRNEADLLLTKMSRVIYVTFDNQITLTTQNGNNDSYISIKSSPTATPVITGFRGNKIYINNEEYHLNSNIKVKWANSLIVSETNNENENIYSIQITLESKKGLQKKFTTNVPSIKMLEEES